MILRQLPGLATLGLLTALLAHEAVFGSSHVAGGVYHATLTLTAIAGSGGFALLAAVLGAFGAGRMGDGSILAASLRPGLPGFTGLAAASGGWFALIEALEPHHTYPLPVIAIVVALIVCAALISTIARGAVGALAGIVLAVTRAPHRKRAQFVHYWFSPAPSARAVAFAYRRFARPPPLA